MKQFLDLSETTLLLHGVSKSVTVQVLADIGELAVQLVETKLTELETAAFGPREKGN